ncbi:MAG: PIG-L family deacetylase [Planctomycetota bacterium]
MADILVISPHPDDAEIHAGGLIAAHIRMRRSVVICDATAGELGSRGTQAGRAQEAEAAAQELGITTREQLGLPDGYLNASDLQQRAIIISAIRRHRPAVIVALSEHARHPDHIALAGLVRGAVKAAALHKLPAPGDHPAWGGARLWFVEAELPLVATLLVPLTAEDWGRKMRAVRCYGSQLHQPGSTAPVTSISQPGFVEWIEARGRERGHHAAAPYAEALMGPEAARISDLCSVS